MAFVFVSAPASGLRPTPLGSSGIADGPSRDDGLCYRVIAEGLAQDSRVHRLVAEDAAGLGEIAITEQRNRAKIGADRALARGRSRSAARGLTECG
jgi:hypothetical protein